ncbi:ribosome hibernation-promoting factor, HPF/YfiA family [Halioxenophilus sp. WMMB6]|uniref:ribosome hibernation-promoting factor, HPF/YfiA family n=1 Tax=Halioxenophilus sp. WMMB6 TaxID=3073815 RepID=UPI00295EC3ED|nr:ribosome-associated translation inhibitor RaiA [Halioxenophilus sp. WMMB6]
MQLNIAGQHLDITPAIEAGVTQKLNKLANHYPELEQANVWLKVEPKQQIVDIVTHFRHSQIAVHAADKNLYVAIKDAVRKLDSALGHREGTQQAYSRSKRPAFEESFTAAEE